MAVLDCRDGKLERELQEVDRERKVLSKRLEERAAKIKADHAGSSSSEKSCEQGT